MDDRWTPVAGTLANTINPAFVLLLLFAGRGQSRREWGWWILRCVACVGTAVALAESGKRWEVWPQHPLFPSGHETFATACAVCLIARDRRWTVPAVALTSLMGTSLVQAGFHTPVETAGGLGTGMAVAGAVGAVLNRVRPRPELRTPGSELP